MTLDPQTLKRGDRFVYQYEARPVVVEVTGEQEPCRDLFGREMVRYLCRRSDTGATGYMVYGPGAAPLEAAPAPTFGTDRLDFVCSGRVELRAALAAIKRQRPRHAEIVWVNRERKSTDNLPDIEVPPGTVLTLTTRSGLPRLRVTAGRVVFRACSFWGNALTVEGGHVHVRTDGGDRKVTIARSDASTALVTTHAEEIRPGSRLFVYGGDPIVVDETDEGWPTSWA